MILRFELNKLSFLDFKQGGDEVLIHNEDKRRITCLMRLVTKVFPGKYGVIIIVHVKTRNGVLLRTRIQILYPLEIGNVPCERIKIMRDSFYKGGVC